jgi:hypothetical protein
MSHVAPHSLSINKLVAIARLETRGPISFTRLFRSFGIFLPPCPLSSVIHSRVAAQPYDSLQAVLPVIQGLEHSV